jgi:negative regulator of sigma E activity
MNEELDSQLSAMFDNELPAAECELLARRLSRDPDLKARWGRYAVIGAVIRSERGVTLDGSVAGRVNAALSSEPALSLDEAGRGADRRSRVQWWQPVAGIGLAAGVAAASILWLRSQALPGGGPALAPALVASASLPAVRPVAHSLSGGATTPDSFVVPPISQRPVVVPATELADYVVAHSAFSWPFTRGSLLSALMVNEPGTSSTPVRSVQPAAGVQGNAIQNPK